MILFGGVPQGLALGHKPFKCRKFLWRDHTEGVFNECVRGHIVVAHTPIPTALAAPVLCGRRQAGV